MSDSTMSNDTPILVEFTSESGVVKASLGDLLTRNREELADKSSQALDGAIDAIRQMAQHISGLRDDIPSEFSQVEVEFGIKLIWEVGAVLAKAGTEGTINVKLTWEREEKPVALVPPTAVSSAAETPSG